MRNYKVRRISYTELNDLLFQLTKVEIENLRSQLASSRSEHGGRRSLPFAFTEQGVAMLSTVLNSERAIEVNITIMRAFIKLRQILETNEELNRKFATVIRKLSTHDKYFKVVFDELKKVIADCRFSIPDWRLANAQSKIFNPDESGSQMLTPTRYRGCENN